MLESAGQVQLEQRSSDIGGEVTGIERERDAVEVADPLEHDHRNPRFQLQSLGHDRCRGNHLGEKHPVDYPIAPCLEGFRQTTQPIQSLHGFLGDDEGARTGNPIDQTLIPQQREGVAHDVAAGNEVGRQLCLRGQWPVAVASRRTG